MKTRGTDEQLKPIDMIEIEKEVDLPGIDYNHQWKCRPDRPPFRQISPQNRKISLKSLGGNGSNRKVNQSPDKSPVPKRSKNQLSAASSNSEPDSPAGSPAKENRMEIVSD